MADVRKTAIVKDVILWVFSPAAAAGLLLLEQI
jgi:hypothetical protein